MRVKMLTDAPGSPDGIRVNEYSKDQVYEVTESLAAAFIAENLAVEDEADPEPDAEPEEEPEGADTEDLTEAEEDESKQLDGPAENK